MLIRKVFISHPKLFCNVHACCWIASHFHNASSSMTALGEGSWMQTVSCIVIYARIYLRPIEKDYHTHKPYSVLLSVVLASFPVANRPEDSLCLALWHLQQKKGYQQKSWFHCFRKWTSWELIDSGLTVFPWNHGCFSKIIDSIKPELFFYH